MSLFDSRQPQVRQEELAASRDNAKSPPNQLLEDEKVEVGTPLTSRSGSRYPNNTEKNPIEHENTPKQEVPVRVLPFMKNKTQTPHSQTPQQQHRKQPVPTDINNRLRHCRTVSSLPFRRSPQLQSDLVLYRDLATGKFFSTPSTATRNHKNHNVGLLSRYSGPATKVPMRDPRRWTGLSSSTTSTVAGAAIRFAADLTSTKAHLNDHNQSLTAEDIANGDYKWRYFNTTSLRYRSHELDEATMSTLPFDCRKSSSFRPQLLETRDMMLSGLRNRHDDTPQAVDHYTKINLKNQNRAGERKKSISYSISQPTQSIVIPTPVIIPSNLSQLTGLSSFASSTSQFRGEDVTRVSEMVMNGGFRSQIRSHITDLGDPTRLTRDNRAAIIREQECRRNDLNRLRVYLQSHLERQEAIITQSFNKLNDAMKDADDPNSEHSSLDPPFFDTDDTDYQAIQADPSQRTNILRRRSIEKVKTSIETDLLAHIRNTKTPMRPQFFISHLANVIESKNPFDPRLTCIMLTDNHHKNNSFKSSLVSTKTCLTPITFDPHPIRDPNYALPRLSNTPATQLMKLFPSHFALRRLLLSTAPADPRLHVENFNRLIVLAKASLRRWSPHRWEHIANCESRILESAQAEIKLASARHWSDTYGGKKGRRKTKIRAFNALIDPEDQSQQLLQPSPMILDNSNYKQVTHPFLTNKILNNHISFHFPHISSSRQIQRQLNKAKTITGLLDCYRSIAMRYERLRPPFALEFASLQGCVPIHDELGQIDQASGNTTSTTASPTRQNYFCPGPDNQYKYSATGNEVYLISHNELQSKLVSMRVRMRELLGDLQHSLAINHGTVLGPDQVDMILHRAYPEEPILKHFDEFDTLSNWCEIAKQQALNPHAIRSIPHAYSNALDDKVFITQAIANHRFINLQPNGFSQLKAEHFKPSLGGFFNRLFKSNSALAAQTALFDGLEKIYNTIDKEYVLAPATSTTTSNYNNINRYHSIPLFGLVAHSKVACCSSQTNTNSLEMLINRVHNNHHHSNTKGGPLLQHESDDCFKLAQIMLCDGLHSHFSPSLPSGDPNHISGRVMDHNEALEIPDDDFNSSDTCSPQFEKNDSPTPSHPFDQCVRQLKEQHQPLSAESLVLGLPSPPNRDQPQPTAGQSRHGDDNDELFHEAALESKLDSVSPTQTPFQAFITPNHELHPANANTTSNVPKGTKTNINNVQHNTALSDHSLQTPANVAMNTDSVNPTNPKTSTHINNNNSLHTNTNQVHLAPPDPLHDEAILLSQQDSLSPMATPFQSFITPSHESHSNPIIHAVSTTALSSVRPSQLPALDEFAIPKADLSKSTLEWVPNDDLYHETVLQSQLDSVSPMQNPFDSFITPSHQTQRGNTGDVHQNTNFQAHTGTTMQNHDLSGANQATSQSAQRPLFASFVEPVSHTTIQTNTSPTSGNDNTRGLQDDDVKVDEDGTNHAGPTKKPLEKEILLFPRRKSTNRQPGRRSK